METTHRDNLHVVVGWLPRVAGQSLAQGSTALAPAVLYGDRVTVICPQSDDALEMPDYFELRDAVAEMVKFDALDSRYAALDDSGTPVVDATGDFIYQPYAPAVWSRLLSCYVADARTAFGSGSEQDALDSLSRAAVMLDGPGRGHGEIVEMLHAELPDVAFELVARAVSRAHLLEPEVTASWLLGALTEAGSARGRYPLLDDAKGLLSEESRRAASDALGRYAKVRAAEAGLGAAVLRSMPSPDVNVEWSELADIRSRLDVPLRRFRAAMAELSGDVSVDPLTLEFDEAADTILRTKVWPALDELEELVRDATFRRIFFRDVAGDLAAYVGPALGLATASSGSVPLLASAAIGAVTPVASSVAHVIERRQATHRHNFFFVREVGRRLRRE